MLMCNDSVWQVKKKTQHNMNSIHRQLRISLSDSSQTDEPGGSWDRMAEEMMANFFRSEHPVSFHSPVCVVFLSVFVQ